MPSTSATPQMNTLGSLYAARARIPSKMNSSPPGLVFTTQNHDRQGTPKVHNKEMESC